MKHVLLLYVTVVMEFIVQYQQSTGMCQNTPLCIHADQLSPLGMKYLSIYLCHQNGLGYTAGKNFR